jgi:hypothetical protein
VEFIELEDGVGDGDGVGLGVGLGVGVGVGDGLADWAKVGANGNVMAMPSTNATAIVRRMPRRLPAFPVRKGLDEQRINMFPENGAARRKIMQNLHQPWPICPRFPGSVNRSRLWRGADCGALLFRCHRSKAGRSPQPRLPRPQRMLAEAHFSC